MAEWRALAGSADQLVTSQTSLVTQPQTHIHYHTTLCDTCIDKRIHIPLRDVGTRSRTSDTSDDDAMKDNRPLRNQLVFMHIVQPECRPGCGAIRRLPYTQSITHTVSMTGLGIEIPANRGPGQEFRVDKLHYYTELYPQSSEKIAIA